MKINPMYDPARSVVIILKAQMCQPRRSKIGEAMREEAKPTKMISELHIAIGSIVKPYGARMLTTRVVVV